MQLTGKEHLETYKITKMAFHMLKQKLTKWIPTEQQELTSCLYTLALTSQNTFGLWNAAEK